MSESDSDLDFESADEDAEFASHTKHQTLSEKSSNEISSSGVISSLASKIDEIKIKEASESDVEIVVNDVSELGSAVELPLDTVLKHVQDDLNTQSESLPCETTNTDKDSLIQEKNETGSKNLYDNNPNTKTDVKAIAKSPKEERVVLRLEKKMQQKSHVSKDLTVEKESQPDMVNPLPNSEKETEKNLNAAYIFPVPSKTVQSFLFTDDKRILYSVLPLMQSSWGFSSWGTSLFSTAASSVSTFSSQVSQGIGTVLETVENTLGAPPPEALAKVLNERKEKAECDSIAKEDSSTEEQRSWTKVFENTGSMVLMGGLDTLELIGKKTMDILTDGDPGLRNKRSVFSEKVNLSEILKEAKAKADAQDGNSDSLDENSIHYSQVFDEKQGLVHLEALEMLSKQCQAKFQRLLLRHSKNVEIKKKLEEIKVICENIPSLDEPSDCESFEDFETVFKKNIIELGLLLNVDSIIKTQRQINDTMSKYENEPGSCPKEIYQSAICSLAELTAKCIEIFHKVSELILVQPKLSTDVEKCATCLTGVTTVMCIEVNNVSSRYHKCLDAYIESNSSSGDITSLATNLYVEAANSNKYIQDAYQMLVPVLQSCLLEALEL